MSNIRKLAPVFLLVMTFPVWGQIPVNQCSSTLSVPGGYYILTADLNCNNETAAFISADNVTFDLQGHTINLISHGPSTWPVAIITVDLVHQVCKVTNGVQIHHGTITGFSTAISLCAPTPSSGSSNAQIHQMTLTGNGIGIALFDAADTFIHNNVISDSFVIPGALNPTGVGIYLAGSKENQVKNNTFKNNASAGILLKFGSNDNTIMNNSVVNTGPIAAYQSGIVLSASPPCVDNIVKNNGAFGSITDLKDGNGSCALNLWKNNKYNTKDPVCIN